jgi:hypothetical protein
MSIDALRTCADAIETLCGRMDALDKWSDAISPDELGKHSDTFVFGYKNPNKESSYSYNTDRDKEFTAGQKARREYEASKRKSDAAIYEIAYAEAYELKDGGFRGVAKNKDTGEIKRGEVRKTLEEARNDAKNFAAQLIGNTPVRTGPVSKKNNWRCWYYADVKKS